MKKEVMFENYLGRTNQTIAFELTNYHCPNCGKKEVWTEPFRTTSGAIQF